MVRKGGGGKKKQTINSALYWKNNRNVYGTECFAKEELLLNTHRLYYCYVYACLVHIGFLMDRFPHSYVVGLT